MAWFSPSEKGVRIQVRVQPRSAKNEIAGVQDRYLRVKLTAPPVGGAANRMLRVFLGEVFHCGAGRVTILKGERGRIKLVELEGVTVEQLIDLTGGLPSQRS